MDHSPVASVEIVKMRHQIAAGATDVVAIEEPFEIQLEYSTATGRMVKNIAVTMRTPGNDRELALGFLFTEGMLSKRNQVLDCWHTAGDENRIRVVLHENMVPDLTKLARNFFASSGCGICGKAGIDSLRTNSPFSGLKNSLQVEASMIYALPELLRKGQLLFTKTGGIHAAGLFDAAGSLLYLREDIGRHNAVDKIIGAAFSDGRLPLSQYLMVLSGRAGFELIQKAAMAGIGAVAAIGAPSSLAVELAKEAGMLLVGFLKEETMNIYAGKEHIKIIDKESKNGK